MRWILLCAKGAKTESKGPEGFTALMIAAHAGDLPVVETLVEKGADVKRQNRNGSDLPLSLPPCTKATLKW